MWWWPPTLKLFLLLLDYYNFATTMNCNANVFRDRGLSKGSLPTSWEPRCSLRLLSLPSLRNIFGRMHFESCLIPRTCVAQHCRECLLRSIGHRRLGRHTLGPEPVEEGGRRQPRSDHSSFSSYFPLWVKAPENLLSSSGLPGQRLRFKGHLVLSDWVSRWWVRNPKRTMVS